MIDEVFETERRIAPLPTFHGCRKRRLKAQQHSHLRLQSDGTAMGLLPVTSAVFLIALILVKRGRGKYRKSNTHHPPTLIPVSVSTTCFSSCCDKDSAIILYGRPPA
jgi:hypothetical protein